MEDTTNNDKIAVLFEAIRSITAEIKALTPAQKSTHQRKNLRKLCRKMDEVLMEADDLYSLPDQIVEVDEEDIDLADVDITPVGITEDIPDDEVVTRFTNRTNKGRDSLKAIRNRLNQIRARR